MEALLTDRVRDVLRALKRMRPVCKHVIQSRFKRAGMRWKQPGFLNVLALRIARLNTTLQAFWASRGLVIPASV